MLQPKKTKNIREFSRMFIILQQKLIKHTICWNVQHGNMYMNFPSIIVENNSRPFASLGSRKFNNLLFTRTNQPGQKLRKCFTIATESLQIVKHEQALFIKIFEYFVKKVYFIDGSQTTIQEYNNKFTHKKNVSFRN